MARQMASFSLVGIKPMPDPPQLPSKMAGTLIGNLSRLAGSAAIQLARTSGASTIREAAPRDCESRMLGFSRLVSASFRTD